MNLYPERNEQSDLRSSFSSFRSKPRTKMLAGITMAFVAPILLLLVLDPRLPKEVIVQEGLPPLPGPATQKTVKSCSSSSCEEADEEDPDLTVSSFRGRRSIPIVSDFKKVVKQGGKGYQEGEDGKGKGKGHETNTTPTTKTRKSTRPTQTTNPYH